MSVPAEAQPAVLTHHNDPFRSGVYSEERVLDSKSLTPDNFGRVLDFCVDGQVYAQPLYVPKLLFKDGITRNVLYVATMRNYLYAFDADAKSSTEAQPLWTLGPSQLGDPVPFNFRHLVFAPFYNVHDSFGITSTPAIDLAEGAIYFVAKTLRPPHQAERDPLTRHFLYKVSLREGAVLASTEITARVPGTGYGSSQGWVPFEPDLQLQRAALLISHGSVYLGFGSHQDTPEWHGWLFQYSASHLTQQHVWCVTPDGKRGAIWQAGAGPAADADGNLYVMTGNGTIATAPGRRDYSMSFVKLTADLQVMGWYRQKLSRLLNLFDLDLGAAGPVLAEPDFIVGGGKQGRLFVVDGKTPAGGTGPYELRLASSVQATPQFGPPFLIVPALGLYHIHGLPVVFHSSTGTYVYVWAEKDYLKRFELLANGSSYELSPKKGKDAPNSKPVHAPRPGLKPLLVNSMPGGMLSLSANGADIETAIVWASMPREKDAWIEDVPGVLRAMDASTLEELWNNSKEPQQYKFAKYCPPTVANGRVYLATFSGIIAVYGPKR